MTEFLAFFVALAGFSIWAGALWVMLHGWFPRVPEMPRRFDWLLDKAGWVVLIGGTVLAVLVLARGWPGFVG